MEIIQYLTEWPGLALTGFSFLLVIMPVFLFIHRLLPKRVRPVSLLAFSLIFCGFAQPGGFPLMAASVLWDYLTILAILRFRAKKHLHLFFTGVAIMKGLAVLLYGGLVLGQSFLLPVMTVYVLSGLSAVIDATRQKESIRPDIINFSVYCCFFPRLYGGILQVSEDFENQLTEPDYSVSALISGFGRYIIGVFKARIIGAQFATLWFQLAGLGTADITVLSGWVSLLIFALAIYFILCGYSDMAQGAGLMFGLRLPGNFYYPYQSRSIGDFFERFLMTVGRFTKRYLNLPYDGFNLVLREILNRLVLGICLGLCFGFRAESLLWGLLLAVISILERFAYPGLLREIPTFLCRVATFFTVLLSFTVLSAGDFAEIASHFGELFGFSEVAFVNDQILYLLASNWLILLIGCFFATNMADVAGRLLARSFPKFGKLGYLLLALTILGAYMALSL